MPISKLKEERRNATFARVAQYLEGRGTEGATSTEIAAALASSLSGRQREYQRGVVQRATADLRISGYGITFERHHSDHPQGNFVYHLLSRMDEVKAVRIECSECHEAKPRNQFPCAYRGCSRLLTVCNVCVDAKTVSAQRVVDAERKRHWKQCWRVATGTDSRNAQDYQPARGRVSICKECYDLPHARPKTGLCTCGRPRYEEALPPLQERSFDRVAVP
jgi:hypothetical protein